MCGIYGAVARGALGIDGAVFERMADALVHRGPDGDGRVVRGPVALGCRRLAIIDVAGGAQPLRNENDDVLVVCNGEIYNHAVLRADLAARGHRFRTRSDAEVIPHLYEERGLDFLDALDGMFGLALWDARTGTLVLARDRLGEKPLFYSATPDGFLFASEATALLATGLVDRTADGAALGAYLRAGYVSAPDSAFTAIRKLPPGGRLVLQGEGVRIDRYWNVVPLLAGRAAPLDLSDATVQLRGHLRRAVEAAMVSDVPLGVFLSGGLDSTAVAALARAAAGPSLNTFALGFDERGFDERDHAALVARALGTRHHSLTVTPSLFIEGTRRIARVLDEPLADPALVPTYLLAEHARREVKVTLVGEGSDELFAGYPTYVGGLMATRYRRWPLALRRRLGAAAPLLGAPSGNTTVRYLLRRFLEAAEAPAAAGHRAWTGCMSAATLRAVATPGGPFVEPEEPGMPAARTELDALLALDLTGYLPDDLLTKLDRGTMAASLEGRAPFLDHHLVEFACRLPASFKLRGVVGKQVLRLAVADLVPDSIRRRVKRGLTVPLAEWMTGPLLPFVRDTLDRLDARLVRRAAVETLLEEHVARRRDNRRELWALVMLQLWTEAHAPTIRGQE
jgi:asparagine synthase (glutamine-hydrolysing)